MTLNLSGHGTGEGIGVGGLFSSELLTDQQAEKISKLMHPHGVVIIHACESSPNSQVLGDRLAKRLNTTIIWGAPSAGRDLLFPDGFSTYPYQNDGIWKIARPNRR